MKKSIIGNLRKQLSNFEYKEGKVINSCYGYKWEYEKTDDLNNEIWKDIRDIYLDAGDYKISNFGRVKNHNDVLVSVTIDGGGYKIVRIGIDNKRFKIHRLVAELFIKNPEKKRCVNHKDGNKLNNCLDNLEWNTHSENVQHAMDNNLNKCSKKIKVTNLSTGEIQIFKNQKDAHNNLHISKKN